MARSDQVSLVPPAGWLEGAEAGVRDFSLPFLLSMTMVGAVLRLFELTGQSLWVDEILTWHAVRPDGGFGFWEQVRDAIQGPLYLAVIWPLVHVHQTALMLRLPAAVAGILAVPVFGCLAFRLVNGRAARLALLLFAVNPFLIWYSQEGRGYAFLLLFSLVTVWCYLRLVELGPKLWRVLGFALAGAAMVLSNLAGVFLLVALGVSLVVVQRPQGRAAWGWWLLAFGLVAAMVAPWLLRASGIWAVDRLVPGAGTGTALRGATTFSFMAVPYALFTFFFGYSLGPSLRELHQPDRLAVLQAYLPLLLAGAGATGMALLAALWRPGRRLVMLLIWIVVPLLLAMLLAQRNIKPWNARYVLVTLPWLLLLAGSGLARYSGRWRAVPVLLLVGLTLSSLAGYYGNDKYAKADLRGAVTWAQTEGAADTTVLVPVVTGVFAFYDRGTHWLIDSYGMAPLAGMVPATDYVQTSLAGVDSCLVVLSREWYFDPEGYLLPALAGIGELEPAGELAGVELFKWRRRDERRPALGTERHDDL